MTNIESFDTPEVARLLHTYALDRAAAGYVADDYLGSLNAPRELIRILGEHVSPPDRAVGTRVVRGLLGSLLPKGPTPDRWGLPQDTETRALDIAVATVALAIGHPFAWTGQQGGRLVHDIVPTEGQEAMQVGASSQTALEWHTEDAFHPERAHIIMLVCLRNPDRIGSRVTSVRDLDIDDTTLRHLYRPDVQIVPDDSYPQSWQLGEQPGIATVWAAPDGHCLRYDPAYTRFLGTDAQLRSAYDSLAASLERASKTLDIGPGDILLIDNDLIAHGRAAFTPRYDGTDRWLKRILLHLDRSRPTEGHAHHGYDRPVVARADRREGL